MARVVSYIGNGEPSGFIPFSSPLEQGLAFSPEGWGLLTPAVNSLPSGDWGRLISEEVYDNMVNEPNPWFQSDSNETTNLGEPYRPSFNPELYDVNPDLPPPHLLPSWMQPKLSELLFEL